MQPMLATEGCHDLTCAPSIAAVESPPPMNMSLIRRECRLYRSATHELALRRGAMHGAAVHRAATHRHRRSSGAHTRRRA